MEYKPQTVVKMISEGFSSFPTTLPGIAKVLSILDTNQMSKVTSFDLQLIRSITRFVVFYEILTYRLPNELLKIGELEELPLITHGEFYILIKKQYNGKPKEALSMLIETMKKLEFFIDETSSITSNMAISLWQYKMGQEIVASHNRINIIKKKELFLQNDISKFLIERNMLSFGRTFGRSEIDIYIKETTGEEFVIEVKIYRKSIKKNDIIGDLVQLFSYMDQVTQPRGVLVIFNFTDNTIIAPRKWIKGRVWILAINLCSKSPSKRIKSIGIVESPNSKELIHCLIT